MQKHEGILYGNGVSTNLRLFITSSYNFLAIMKTFYFKTFLALAGIGLLLAGCKKETETVRQYIYISDGLCTFRGTENSEMRVKVEASPLEWQVSAVPGWMTADKEGEELVISVQDNTTGTERTADVEITAGNASSVITVRQLSDLLPSARFRLLNELHSSAISPSGKWAGGYYSVGDESTGASMHYIVFVNLEDDQVTKFGPYPEALMLLTSVRCISDQGVMYAVDGHGGIKVFDVYTKDYSVLSASGYDSNVLGIGNVSADGRIWVGHVDMAEGGATPLMCTDGSVKVLPVPDRDYRDLPVKPNAIARGISADGSVVYGTTWDNRDFGMIYWDKDGNVHYVGEDVREIKPVKRPDGNGGFYDYNMVDGMISWSGQYQISPNGKYIAGTYRTEEIESEEDGSISENKCAAFFNTETQQTTIFPEFGDASGLAVTDDGIGFVGTPSLNTAAGWVVNIETGENLGTVQKWALATYGIYVPQGYIIYMPADSDMIWGGTLTVTAMATFDLPTWYVAPPLDKE